MRQADRQAGPAIGKGHHPTRLAPIERVQEEEDDMAVETSKSHKPLLISTPSPHTAHPQAASSTWIPPTKRTTTTTTTTATRKSPKKKKTMQTMTLKMRTPHIEHLTRMCVIFGFPARCLD